MKTVNMKLFQSLIVAFSCLVWSSHGFATDLIVHIYKPVNAYGKIHVGLHLSQKSSELFDDIHSNDYQAVQTKSIDASPEKLTITFKNVEEGVYAVSAFHDVNSDGTLNRELFPYSGMPLESFGFSKNRFNSFSTPEFSDGSIEVFGTVTEIQINLQHSNSVAAKQFQQQVMLGAL